MLNIANIIENSCYLKITPLIYQNERDLGVNADYT